MEKPATYPTFNSITNNPTIGDERDFVHTISATAATDRMLICIMENYQQPDGTIIDKYGNYDDYLEWMQQQKAN